MVKNYLTPLFFGRRFYLVFSIIIACFLIAYASTIVFVLAKLLLLVFLLLVLLDYLVLFLTTKGVTGSRMLPSRFSLGDDNLVTVALNNNYQFSVHISAIDELPVQFQRRDFNLKTTIVAGVDNTVSYSLRPMQRGEYQFHLLNVFVSSPLRLVVKRYRLSAPAMIKVYPSYQNLKKFELLASSNNLSEYGHRRIRKIGQSVEFEQIREYVNGDDIRTLNWKATARKGGQLMINNYTDEKSQQIYCLMDKGRVMKMPFEGMTLLDYSINAALMLTRVALIRQDKAGLLSFNDKIDQFVIAGRKQGQMNAILETLYDQDTKFAETDYEKVYGFVKSRILQRSLIVLFTNFESLSGLQRQIPYIRAIARNHLLLVVFFENTGLKALTGKTADDIETLYLRTIAGKFEYEKKQMVKELQQHGIFTILTTPQQLTVNAVNKYLELKARQAV